MLPEKKKKKRPSLFVEIRKDSGDDRVNKYSKYSWKERMSK